MYQYMIGEMTDLVMAALTKSTDNPLRLLDPYVLRKLIHTALSGYWADKVAIVWSKEDILEELPGLTEDEALFILKTVVNDHDATLGVNWNSFRNYALMKFGKRVLEKDG